MKCNKISCNQKPIIRFEYEIHNESYCLEHLVKLLDYINEKEFYHLLKDAKKIIPIFNF